MEQNYLMMRLFAVIAEWRRLHRHQRPYKFNSNGGMEDQQEIMEDLQKIRDMCQEAIYEIGKNTVGTLQAKHDDVKGITWYEPKNKPQYVNDRSVSYLYIGKYDSGKTFLRWKTIYTGDDWVFFDKIIFNVDGYNFSIPYDKDTCYRDNGGGAVWEVMDVEPDKAWTRLLQLIATSENTIIRFEGDHKYRDVTLSQTDKDSIRDVLCVFQSAAINELK